MRDAHIICITLLSKHIQCWEIFLYPCQVTILGFIMQTASLIILFFVAPYHSVESGARGSVTAFGSGSYKLSCV